FCTALAQVQRVELPVEPQTTCDCCENAGDCGMPECGLPPAAMPSTFAIEQTVKVTRPAATTEIAPAKAISSDFWVAVPVPAAPCAPLPFSPGTAPPAVVPLFKAHCAYLI